MADFLQDHPLLILAILIGNSLWISLLCYCGLRYWIAKRYYSNNEVAVVTQYIIESQSTVHPRPPEPFSDVRNIIIVERASVGSNSGNNACDHPLPQAGGFTTDELPPKYCDIFPQGNISKSSEIVNVIPAQPTERGEMR